MKRVGIALILTLVLSFAIAPVAFATVAPPDYEKEGSSVWATCDNGDPSVILYNTETYGLNVATTKSGHVFYFLLDNTGDHFLYKAAGSPEVTGLSHEAWDAKLKEHAMNFYNLIHNSGPTDCQRGE